MLTCTIGYSGIKHRFFPSSCFPGVSLSLFGFIVSPSTHLCSFASPSLPLSPSYNKHIKSNSMPLFGFSVASTVTDGPSFICRFHQRPIVRSVIGECPVNFTVEERRYTSLNAASLTVLAVAVKLSMDLTTKMPGSSDQAAKGTSTTFLCVSTAHFMPSLGSMSGKDMLLNLTALCILIVTLSVNVIIQVLTGTIREELQMSHLVTVFMTIYTLIISCFSALTVFTSKKYLEHRYNELHKKISTEELHGNEIMDFDKLKLRIKKYWVMAETGNPQFVIARSEATGIALCVIPSMGRLSVTLLQTVRNIRKCTISDISLEMKNYKIRRLVEWKKRPPPLQVRGLKLRKIICDIRNLLLNILIGNQIVTVIINKLLGPISICGFLYILVKMTFLWVLPTIILTFTILLFLCILRMKIRRYFVILWKKLLRESEETVEPNESEGTLNNDHQELRNFILLLENETIHAGYVMFIDSSINSSVKRGAKNQPRGLIELIDQNSTSFEGVLAFESDQVLPILIPTEIPNCWSLPLTTLTSIIIALPQVLDERKNGLLRCVVEGFKYVRLVEKTLDIVNKKMATSTIAADSAWIDVEMRRKWLDADLQKIARVSKTSKETLERLAYKSEEILKGFRSNTSGDAVESSPVNLPESVIIANSMYKISNTLLLLVPADESESGHTASADAELFDKYLSVIMADIFAACLSNLPHVILKKCSNSAIEEREESIRDATRLLGETQGIMKALQKREIPNLSPDQLVYIDEWRAFLKCANNAISESTASTDQNIIATSGSDLRLDIRSSTSETLETDEDTAESRACGEAEEFREENENI